MKILQELLRILDEADVTRSTAAAVYHRDYVKTKRKKYRKYDPKKREHALMKEGQIDFPGGYSTEQLKKDLEDALKDVKVIQRDYPDELDGLETYIDQIRSELYKRRTSIKEDSSKDVNNLNVGDYVCFKYDVEQCSKIEKVINRGYGRKEYVVRAFHGEYVDDHIDGTVITVQPRDCWID